MDEPEKQRRKHRHNRKKKQMKNRSKIAALLIAAALTLTTQGASHTDQRDHGSFTAGLAELNAALASATNWSVVGGYGRSTKGDRNLVFADIAYAFNNNFESLLVLMTAGEVTNGSSISVKVVLTLQAPGHLFAFIARRAH